MFTNSSRQLRVVLRSRCGLDARSLGTTIASIRIIILFFTASTATRSAPSPSAVQINGFIEGARLPARRLRRTHIPQARRKLTETSNSEIADQCARSSRLKSCMADEEPESRVSRRSRAGSQHFFAYL